MAQTEYGSDPQPSPEREGLRVARIGKPHGVRGEVTVELFTDEPEARLGPGAVLERRPGKGTEDRTTQQLTVSSQRWNKKICMLSFEDVRDRDAAEALRGSTLHIEIPDEDEQEGWYSHELEGMVCQSPDGHPYGVVVELVTGPAQDLLAVRTEAGDEVLIPFVEEIVPDISADERIITLTPPEGLI
ncbi:ribosome maturation factor RimM [Nesterenkonia sp. NBAIMH1]|uniref:ribosome maturation factor RimM n=1 Tax=Nesterenkonia sp. NBAIMH1 TaxID=2600320 RepID=UPI0011B69BDB|nr:ribosome maturation factor RimM [Nesterenkonia sp. NBAIMH1]